MFIHIDVIARMNCLSFTKILFQCFILKIHILWRPSPFYCPQPSLAAGCPCQGGTPPCCYSWTYLDCFSTVQDLRKYWHRYQYFELLKDGFNIKILYGYSRSDHIPALSLSFFRVSASLTWALIWALSSCILRRFSTICRLTISMMVEVKARPRNM